MILLSIILIYSHSRAAWLATGSGILVLFFMYKVKTYSIYRKLKTTPVNVITGFLLISAISIAVYLLYHFKKDSADGRILIWKSTINMIADKPFFGHGINSFQSNYMNYQADYLDKNPLSNLSQLAKDNKYAFNEPLRIVSEEGLFGFSFLLFMGWLIVSSKGNEKSKVQDILLFRISKIGIIGIIIFGLFSYPSHVLQLKALFIIFISIQSEQSKFLFSMGFEEISNSQSPKIASTFLFIVSFIFISLSMNSLLKYYKVYNAWNQAFIYMSPDKYNNGAEICQELYPALNNNGDFLAMYGLLLTKLGENRGAIEMFNRAIYLVPSTKLLIELGKNYEAIFNYTEAENCWSKASSMVPSKFLPSYLLVKMLYNIGQKERANKLAHELLNKRIKVHSIEVANIIDDLRKMIKENNSECSHN